MTIDSIYEHLINITPNWLYYDFKLIPPVIVVVSFGILVSIFLCKIVKNTLQFLLPLQTPLFIFVLISGILIKETFLKAYFQHIFILRGGRDLLCVCFSVYAIHSGFSVDKKHLFKILPLIFLAAFGSFLSGIMHGYMMKVVIQQKSSNHMLGFIYGSLFCNTQPYFISAMFFNMENYSYIHYLLEGESILNNAVSLTILDILYGWDKYSIYEWYNIIALILMKVGFGLPLGILLGKLTSLPVIYLKFDMTSINIIVIGMTVLSFKLAELIEISPYITVTTVVFVLVYDRSKFSQVHETYIAVASKVNQAVADMVIGSYCILQIIFGAPVSALEIFHFLVLNYISVLICRFVVFTILYPLAKKLLYPFSFQTFAFILAWTSIMSTNIVCMGIVLLTTTNIRVDAAQIIVFILFNYYCSLLINSTAMGFCIRVLCYQQISQTKVENINSVIRHLLEIRDKSIYLVKMNKFMADVHWDYVRKMTVIEHPYKNEAEKISFQKGVLPPSCPFCNKGMSKMTTSKDNIDTIRETRKEAWTYMKTINIIHYELGMISRESMLVVQKIFDYYLNLETLEVINLDKLKLSFSGNKVLNFLNKIYKKFFSFERSKILVPRKNYRRICYKIIMHKSFSIIMYMVIIIACIPSTFETEYVIWMNNTLGSKSYAAMVFIDYLILSIYTIELIVTILAYSWVYFWKDGVRTYFRSFWHILDSFTLAILIMELAVYDLEFVFLSQDIHNYLYTNLQRVRLLRLFRIFNGQFPRILNIFQSHVETRLLNSYEIAKALSETIAEFMVVIDKVIPESDFSKEFFQNLEAAKKGLFDLLLQIHMEYPWIITTVKTKQMIACCKYIMIETLLSLKSLGFVDENEYNSLLLAIKGKDDALKTKKKIKPPSPNSIFFNVMWMNIEDAKLGEFLFNHSSVRNYEAGHTFVKIGGNLDGLLIIINGVLKLTYTTENMSKYLTTGDIPVIDGFHLPSNNEMPEYESYIFPGNSVGDLNFLTGRTYDCEIEGITDVKAYIIYAKYVSRAIRLSRNTLDSLEGVMWKYALLNVAEAVLMNSPTYGLHTVREIQLKLEKAFIPDFRGFTTLVLNDVIEDVLLLDGIATDGYTKAIYKAPVHIPKSIVRLNITYQQKFARVMLIPLPDVEVVIPLEIEPRVVEMVTVDDVRCTFFRKKKKGLGSRFNVNSSKRSSSSFSSYSQVIRRSSGSVDRRSSVSVTLESEHDFEVKK